MSEVKTGVFTSKTKVSHTENIELLKKEFPAVISSAKEIAKNGNLNDAIEILLSLEKRSRLLGATEIVTEVALEIIKLCFDAKDWNALNAQLALLAKRRGQNKKTITAFVKESMERLEETPDKDTKVSLIDTLRAVTEGKMYVENERARLTKNLAEMKEAEGDISKAAEILQEVQVETYGTMDKAEKVHYILEQVRLCLAKKDFIRASIISKKIKPKNLEGDDMQTLKLSYYNLMIEFYTYKNDTMALCKCYEAIFRTKVVEEDLTKMQSALSHFILFLALSPYDNEQFDLCNRLLKMEEKKLREIPAFKAVLTAFTTWEITGWPLKDNDELMKHGIFTDSKWGDKSQEWWKLFHKRLVQHNILVVAKYYNRVTMPRLATLLGQPLAETETTVAEMVTEKRLYSKINRPDGIIDFTKPKSSTSTLTEWSHDIGELLSLVDQTSHLITKELNLHKAA